MVGRSDLNLVRCCLDVLLRSSPSALWPALRDHRDVALRDRVDVAFDSWLWPLLGLLARRGTTLMYLLTWSAVGGVSGGDWILVGLGVGARRCHLRGQAVPGEVRDPLIAPSRWRTAIGRVCAFACCAAVLAAVLITVLTPGRPPQTAPSRSSPRSTRRSSGSSSTSRARAPGEPYRPVPVETVLGQSDVVLPGWTAPS